VKIFNITTLPLVFLVNFTIVFTSTTISRLKTPYIGTDSTKMNFSQTHATQGVFGILEQQAQQRPNAVFLKAPDCEITYKDALDSVHSLATWLRDNGVRRGDRVAIHMSNRSEIAIAIFATALVGGVFVVLNERLRPSGLQKILCQAEPTVVIADSTTAKNLTDDTPGIRLLVGAGNSTDFDGWYDWNNAVSTPVERPMSWTGIDVDPACLVFTSGSTGVPRGVTLSHDNICFVVRAIQVRVRYQPSDVIGCFLPLAFDYGLYQIFLTVEAGATLYIGDPNQVGPRLPRILNEAEVSVLPGVPTVYAALLKMHQRRPFELPRLRAITNTGERLPPAYISEMQQRFSGLEVYVMYGLTECKRVSIMMPNELERKPMAVGRALDGTEVYAVSETGERLPTGEAGELVVRGRHVALGYWRAPEETAIRFRKRAPENPVELFTGDTGWVDEDGYIFFAARAADLLKHRGYRISPVEIENEACSIYGVAEAAVLKRESDDTLHLFVTISNTSLSESLILRRLNEILEPAKVPGFVSIERSLPKSLNGKIDRKALQHRLDAAAAAA
jgi:acyl-coenzyme A synthetase/AMP-(fatty) acid ligase